MNRYAIPCTPGQTQKALELGAPIIIQHIMGEDGVIKQYIPISPTAEQMCGWLRSKGIVARGNCYSKVNKDLDIPDWQVLDYNEEKSRWHEKFFGHSDSYEEATLAAIDAALEYLIDNRK